MNDVRARANFLSTNLHFPIDKVCTPLYHVINSNPSSRKGGWRYDDQAARDGDVSGHVHVHVLRFPMRRPLNYPGCIQRAFRMGRPLFLSLADRSEAHDP